jgi:hypothetical protein
MHQQTFPITPAVLQAFEEEVVRLSALPAAKAEMARMNIIPAEQFEKLSNSKV